MYFDSPMNVEQIIEKRKYEIKDLHKFRTYLQVLYENNELSEGTLYELQLRISIRISQCEICIREYQKI